MKHPLDCCLRNQLKELNITVPENTRYISISNSIVPKGKYLLFYGKQGFIKNQIVDDKKYNKIEEILKNAS